MATVDAPPYVSLLDKLRQLGATLQAGGAQLVTSAETPVILTALAHYAEHGDDVIDAAEFGDFHSRVEPILTPDRPEGWTPPMDHIDPREQEIARLRAEISALNARAAGRPDPRDAELESLRQQRAQAETNARGASVQASQPTGSQHGLVDSSSTPPGRTGDADVYSQRGQQLDRDAEAAGYDPNELSERLKAAAPMDVTVTPEPISEDDFTREDLDKIASERGIDNPGSYANKAELVHEINSRPASNPNGGDEE